MPLEIYCSRRIKPTYIDMKHPHMLINILKILKEKCENLFRLQQFMFLKPVRRTVLLTSLGSRNYIYFYQVPVNVITMYFKIQSVSRLYVITAGGDFLGLCDEKSSYKHVSDFGRLRSYVCLKLRIEGKDY
jgi:hypothetical protein